jgi:hypothetical protein
METKKANKMTSLKSRLFLNHEMARANEIRSRLTLNDVSIGTKLRLSCELQETNKKIKLLENGKISEYLGYN